MGMTSATKLRSIVEIAELATAIELITAAQGLGFREPLLPGSGVKRAFDVVRSHVSQVNADRSMSADIQRIAQAIREGEFENL
jgi:histidine ammonia-lyase